MLDLRYPMGMMFALVGAILAIYGAVTNADKMYDYSFGHLNVNLLWGAVLLGFGLIMIAMARWAAAAEARKTVEALSESRR